MKKIILSFLFCALLLPLVSHADGGIIPPTNTVMWETEQKAAIFYESDTQTENLAVSMSFEGNAADFAWIIPVPSKPDVKQGSQDLFTELSKIAVNNEGTIYDYDKIMTPSVGEEPQAVNVVEQKTIDYYDVSVLEATDAEALATWLNDNGYPYPEKYSYIFNDYINNGWYFVAAKIVPAVADDSTVTTALNNGTATPLQLTFTAKNIVYPMKISQIVGSEISSNGSSSEAFFNDGTNSAPSAVNVTLYIIADHKQELSGFTASYGDEIKKEKIKKLALDTQGNPWVEPKDNKYFLTRLDKYSYAIADMKGDLFPQQADNDDAITNENKLDNENITMLVLFSLLFTAIGVVGGVITPFVLFFIIFSIVFYLSANKKIKVVMVVLQILDAAVTLVLSLAGVVAIVLSFVDIRNSLKYSYVPDDEIFTACASIAITATFLFYFIAKLIALIIEKKKYKKLKQ